MKNIRRGGGICHEGRGNPRLTRYILLEQPGRHAGQQQRFKGVFLLLFVPALALAVLQAKGVELPSVMLLLGDAVRALGLSY